MIAIVLVILFGSRDRLDHEHDYDHEHDGKMCPGCFHASDFAFPA